MSRDNATWLLHLRASGADQHLALDDLRRSLLFGLRRALSGRPAADEWFLEDVVQTALLRILDRLEGFQGRSQFLTWATAIAIRIALSELRRRRWKDVSWDDAPASRDGLEGGVLTEFSEPEAAWEQQTMLRKMRDLIESDLTDKQRTALLAELKGVPLDEIARRLGSNRNAIYKLTHDARKKLKRGLEAAGYTSEDIRAATAR